MRSIGISPNCLPHTEPTAGGLGTGCGCGRVVNVGGVCVGVGGGGACTSHLEGLRTSERHGVPASAAFAAFVARQAFCCLLRSQVAMARFDMCIEI